MQVNTELVDYLKAVDATFASVAGLNYSAIYKDLHGDLGVARSAAGMKTAPEAFAKSAIEEARLITVQVAGRDAGPLNRRRAALIEFARENEDWSVGVDGAIYRENDDGAVVRMDLARSVMSGMIGFKIEVAHDASLKSSDGFEDGMSPVIVEGDPEFVHIGSGPDIEDVTKKYDDRYVPASSFGFH